MASHHAGRCCNQGRSLRGKFASSETRSLGLRHIQALVSGTMSSPGGRLGFSDYLLDGAEGKEVAEHGMA